MDGDIKRWQVWWIEFIGQNHRKLYSQSEDLNVTVSQLSTHFSPTAGTWVFQIQHHQDYYSPTPNHLHHHIQWERNQLDGVVGVRHVEPQDPAPPPVHLIFGLASVTLSNCHIDSVTLSHWFCHIVTFPILFDFTTSSHFRSNSSASVTLWS